MIFKMNEQTARDNYKLLIGSVVPRPIAFVTSVSAEGVVNAAPFSYFNIVNNDPPMLMFSCGRHADGTLKDTARNILANQEFVVHVTDEDNIEAINHTSISAPAHISELTLAGLTAVPGTTVAVPRVQESPVAMECRLAQYVELGKFDAIIGEVLSFYVRDDLIHNGRIDISKLKPVSRLAGSSYSAIGRIFDLDRPVYEDQ
ncbi:flavin reductase family protein [Paenibacillus durus]|uniref:Flavin reductase like domain-containing protein n=1 Tax=Paenibacillus durus TaxID=44251 RepID=A0A089HVC0_PAEDU|nr:flavin reductase family protein [Paenibacillus durus]AIQ15032.1 hypothetical protein PDUR_26530 [Paenibacillus durus]